MLDEKMKQKLVEEIVAGGDVMTGKETFTREEVSYLLNSVLIWAKMQIDYTIDELHREDIDQFVSECGYKNVKEAVEDLQSMYESEFASLSEFMVKWVEISFIKNSKLKKNE